MTAQEEVRLAIGTDSLRQLAGRNFEEVEKDINSLIAVAHTSPNRTEILQFAKNMLFMHELWKIWEEEKEA